MATPSLHRKEALRREQGAKTAFTTKKRRSTRFTAALAVFVVLCTAWALMVPAISITQDRATDEAGFFGVSDSAQVSEPDASPESETASTNETASGSSQNLAAGYAPGLLPGDDASVNGSEADESAEVNERGESAEDIIRHYYSGIDIVRLW